jgi:pantothenate synthetase
MAATLEGSRPATLTVVLTVVQAVSSDRSRFCHLRSQGSSEATLVRRMVRIEPLEVDVAPTVRELDGLALSSRQLPDPRPATRRCRAVACLRAVEQS